MNFNRNNIPTPGGKVYPVYSKLSSNAHLLIAGATGSGKSVTENGIIYTLLSTKTPYECQFILIDPKKVELVQYANLPHTLRYASEPVKMIEALSYALMETERRFTTMQARRQKEYTGPDLYVIVDELADLMTTQKKQVLPILQRLAQIGRAARVHIIACTQNVLAVTIPTVLKCNFPVIVGLRTATSAQSRYLIESKGCETLPNPRAVGKGYGYIRDGADLNKCELEMCDDSEINRVINYWMKSGVKVSFWKRMLLECC